MRILQLFKRWFNMIIGKSAFHVKQGEGKHYSLKEIKGYYNDLTGKVSDKTVLDNYGIPINTTIANVEAYFPITIFQYGLGLYDLYLENNSKKLFDQFIDAANWDVENMNENGMWNCMGKLNDTAHETRSTMCQSEGVSVLLRAYVETKNDKYFLSAKKTIDFMLIDVKNGGTTLYNKNEVVFQEYVSKDNLSV